MAEEPQGQQDERTTTGDAPGKNAGEVTFSAQQQAKLDEIVSNRLSRARENWETELEKRQQQEQEQREQERLEEQQEFKQLHEKAQAKVQELEPLAETAQRYQDTIAELNKAALENVPKHIAELLADRDPLTTFQYIQSHRSDWEQPAPQPKDVDGTTRGQQTTNERSLDNPDYRKQLRQRWGI